MNYYIQGDAANAGKIKAAFEKLGYDTGNLQFNSGCLYYTIGGKVELMCPEALQNFIKTHPDYKELELPVEPKFKDGDKVVFGTLHETIAVVLINEQRYLCESCREILFEEQERWHLAPKPHYDIANFHAGMPVLVREGFCCEWRYSIFSHHRKNGTPFCASGIIWHQCIPFEGNEHLLGTTDPCDEQFINW